ncbi:MAG: 50S ribosomal protein L27 [Candidatus Omnitrophica bacterium]|nr:50S ribosomal protein L27 [Candidatus Omnitrophota bacterium]
MVRVGGLTKKYYKETKGMKVSGGQQVKAGTMLTREGHRWVPGLNVNGDMHLVAGCDGEVYFTKKKNRFNRQVTVINIKPAESK